MKVAGAVPDLEETKKREAQVQITVPEREGKSIRI